MSVDIRLAIGDNITEGLDSGAQCRGMQKVWCWNVNETIRYTCIS